MSNTTKLYLLHHALDPRALECQSAVVAVETDPAGRVYAVLGESVFHPQGGGQRCDTGSLGAAAVVDVRLDRESGRILHFLSGPAPAAGDIAYLSVDVERRCLHAALHTAGHLLAAVAARVIPGFVPHAGHHFPNEARVTGACVAAPDPQTALAAIQTGLDQAVLEAWAVSSALAGGRREIAVGAGPAEGCGGTHLADCGALADLRVLKLTQAKGELRIRYSVLGV